MVKLNKIDHCEHAHKRPKLNQKEAFKNLMFLLRCKIFIFLFFNVLCHFVTSWISWKF